MSNHLDLIIRTADAELQSLGDSPYSKPAFAVLRDKISQYIAELVTESTRVAKRHKADTISAAHVNQASDYLIASSSRKFFRHLGTVGGILLGAALGNTLSMVSGGKFESVNVTVTLGLGIVGAFLMAIHIAKD